MTMQFYHFLVPVISVLSFFLFQFIALRTFIGKSYIGIWIIGLVFGVIITIVSHLCIIVMMNDSILNGTLSGLINICTFLLLALLYLTIIQLGISSLRIRIMLELEESDDGLNSMDVLRNYNAEKILQTRLDRLERSGQIIVNQGKYYLGRALVLTMMVKVYSFIEWVLFGGEKR